MQTSWKFYISLKNVWSVESYITSFVVKPTYHVYTSIVQSGQKIWKIPCLKCSQNRLDQVNERSYALLNIVSGTGKFPIDLYWMHSCWLVEISPRTYAEIENEGESIVWRNWEHGQILQQIYLLHKIQLGNFRLNHAIHKVFLYKLHPNIKHTSCEMS